MLLYKCNLINTINVKKHLKGIQAKADATVYVVMDPIKARSDIGQGKKIDVLLNIHCYVNFYAI